jgi:hypothetical protein
VSTRPSKYFTTGNIYIYIYIYIIKSPILSPEPNGSSTLKNQWSHGHASILLSTPQKPAGDISPTGPSIYNTQYVKYICTLYANIIVLNKKTRLPVSQCAIMHYHSGCSSCIVFRASAKTEKAVYIANAY